MECITKQAPNARRGLAALERVLDERVKRVRTRVFPFLIVEA